MQKQFFDLEFTQDQVQLPMPIEARKLCSEHRDSKLTQASWPQEAWRCSCCWHPRLKRALALFEEDAIPDSEHLSLTRGLVSRGALPTDAGKRKSPKGGEANADDPEAESKAKTSNDVHYNADQSVLLLPKGRRSSRQAQS